ncbi:MAG: hypothetical protein EKK46_09730 [Rhodocyclaceae bacterium]|nr:MAG: hypothetical protein EKK46_09730 [Rhodocyclaceae bacterium]
MTVTPLPFRCLLAIGLLSPLLTLADATKPGEKDISQSDTLEYKLTPSWYQLSDDSHATDINLRGATTDLTFWLGQYRQSDGYAQTRGGLERNFDFGLARMTLSGQLAGGGFIGGSVSGEVGNDTYAIWGFGRTNLRDYYNLNFDPNDAITLGLGHRSENGANTSLYTTFDDRLDTGQRVTHGVWRGYVSPALRLTVDLSYKRGRGADDQTYSGTGLSLTGDVAPFFLRIARDPKVNFTALDMTRVSLGVRF